MRKNHISLSPSHTHTHTTHKSGDLPLESGSVLHVSSKHLFDLLGLNILIRGRVKDDKFTSKDKVPLALLTHLLIKLSLNGLELTLEIPNFFFKLINGLYTQHVLTISHSPNTLVRFTFRSSLSSSRKVAMEL